MQQAACLQAIQIALIANIPVLVWGEPGVGKSAAINALAADLGWPIETVLASLREPSDFTGLPIIADGSVRFAAPDWAQRLSEHHPSICFFDEITTAGPATQRALLRVVHERVVGDLVLGPGVRMIAAANPADIATGGWDLTAPLANRFLHLDWTIEPEIVTAGLLGRWPRARTLTLDADWTSPLGSSAAVIAGFLSARPDLVHRRPVEAERAGRAWPSPRTWEMVNRILAVTDSGEIDEEIVIALIAGLVGDGAAIEFTQYRRDLDLPNPEALLRSPGSYQRPDRDDQVHAIVAAVTAAVVGRITPARWTKGLQVLCTIAEQGNIDIAASGVRTLATLRPEGGEVPERLTVFGDILIAAGLIDRTGKVRSENVRRSA